MLVDELIGVKIATPPGARSCRRGATAGSGGVWVHLEGPDGEPFIKSELLPVLRACAPADQAVLFAEVQRMVELAERGELEFVRGARRPSPRALVFRRTGSGVWLAALLEVGVEVARCAWSRGADLARAGGPGAGGILGDEPITWGLGALGLACPHDLEVIGGAG